MKCWKATILTSMSCCPEKTALYHFSQQAAQRPAWPHVTAETRFWRSSLFNTISAPGTAVSVCITHGITRYTFLHEPRRPRQADTISAFWADKPVSTLPKDELNCFPKKPVLTVSSLRKPMEVTLAHITREHLDTAFLQLLPLRMII